MRTVAWLLGGVGVLVLGSMAAFFVYGRSVETWPYEVERRDGDFEIRAYPAMTVAEVTTRGSRQEAVRAGFGPLARYIFARERSGEKIAMTAPVTQEPTDGAEWRVRFVMPAKYDLDDLPRPAGSEVRLVATEPQRMAAIRFKGGWTDVNMSEHEAQLRRWLEAQGLAPTTEATYAYYNDPFTPGFLRRNEVLIGIVDG